MKSHFSGDASENRKGGFGVKDAGLWLSGRGKNMNDLVIIEQKAPDVPKNGIYRLVRLFLRSIFILFLGLCMVIGFGVIFLWSLVLFEEHSSDMTGVGNCGTPKCIDQ